VPDILRFSNGDTEVSANRSSVLSTALLTKAVKRRELLSEIRLQVMFVLNRSIINTLSLSII